jgi:hypothetical protein
MAPVSALIEHGRKGNTCAVRPLYNTANSQTEIEEIATRTDRSLVGVTPGRTMRNLNSAQATSPTSTTPAVQGLDAAGIESTQLDSKGTHAGNPRDFELPEIVAAVQIVRGAAICGVVGVLAGGLVLGPVGLLGVGPWASAVLAGAGAGFYGALAGLLAGRDEHESEQRTIEDVVRQGTSFVAVEPSSLAPSAVFSELLESRKTLSTAGRFRNPQHPSKV